jgi:hypothetical protein
MEENQGGQPMKEQIIEEIENTLITISEKPIMIRGLEHWADVIAEELYNAGYRKQSEGEWVYRENEFGNAYYACSICDCQTRYKENYCSSCGAKMKGE